MSSELPISACITTKNNENTIRECLSSLKGFVDEIVVVDTNSQDNTIKICEEYGCKIIQKEFTGIPDMKMTAVREASNDWVFIIDSDEYLPSKLKKEIRKEFTVNQDTVAYYMKKRNYMFDEWIRADHPERPLLAKKDVIFFEEEYVMEHLSINEDYRDKTVHLSNHIHHNIYEDSHEYVDKHNQYSSLDALRLHDSNEIHTVFFHFIKGTGTCLYYLIICRSILDGWRGIFWSVMHIWYQILVYQKCRDLMRVKRQNPDDWRENWMSKCERK